MNKRVCEMCGKVDYLIGEVRSSKCRSCATSIGRTGCGRKDRGNTGGYRMIYVNRKRVYEHRHVMEIHLGRKLSRNEHVHHIDGNRINNSIENLELTTATDHARHHMTPEIAKSRSKLGHAKRWSREVA